MSIQLHWECFVVPEVKPYFVARADEIITDILMFVVVVAVLLLLLLLFL